jgi:hypothetical protein
MNKLITAMLTGFILLVLSTTVHSEVPIDAPRGSYEGAENIHWYQQQSLKSEDYVDGISRYGAAYPCNEDDQNVSCFGHNTNRELQMYYAQGRVPFNVAIWVDNRVTPGFDFPWRRATREIRRINDALSRSGVNTQVYISAIEYKDLSHLSASAEDIWDYYNGNEFSAIQFARDNKADAVLIIRNSEGLGTREFCGYASIGPTSYWLPVIVLNCVHQNVELEASWAPTAAAHEFGHVLGLGHEYNDGGVTPLVNHGYGHHDSTGNTNTVMSNRDGGRRIAVFSSPRAIWDGAIQGDSETADASIALNDAAVTAALFYERKWGYLSGSGSDTGRARVFSIPATPIGVE